MQKSKDSLKACFENVNIHKYLKSYVGTLMCNDCHLLFTILG